MNLQTNAEVRYSIGRKPLFKKIPRTKSVLGYVSGIQELTLQETSGKLTNTFFIALYPEGLLIADRKSKYRMGLAFSDLKNVEITKRSDDCYEVMISAAFQPRPVVFSFKGKDRLQIIPLIKSLPYKGNSDPRNREVARQEILKLKDEFATDYFTDRNFCQLLKGGSINRTLEINPKTITYGDRVINASDTLGYTTSIEELSHYGVSRFEYGISIYHPDKHLFISFTSASFFLKEGEHTQILSEIGSVLFDVVSRPIVAKWFDEFAKGDTIDCKEFALTRQGLLLKSQKPHILIHWDEIIAQGPDLFRWPYSNTVFQRIDTSYDHRGNMLFGLVKWLQSDPKRMVALMGREYYIS